jgi:hypothetical protein
VDDFSAVDDYSDGAVLAEYRMPFAHRTRAVVGFGLSAVIIGMVTISLAIEEPAAGLFGVACFVMAGIQGYRFVVRPADRMYLHERALRWRTMFGSGRVPLDRLTVIRASRWGSGLAVVEVGDGSAVEVLVNRHFVRFTERITDVAPHVSVRLDWWQRMIGRFGRSR